MKSLFLTAIFLVLATGAWASSTATQNVDVTIPAIDEVSVSGDVTLTFTAPTGGDGFTDATDASTTLDWSTNQATRKITIVYDAAETGLTLKCEATSASGGTSAGELTLSTTAQDFVTAISNTTGSGTLSYTCSATMSASTAAYVVTFTIQSAT